MTNPYQAYQQSENAFLEQKVLSASPLELVCLLYDGGVEAVAQAQRHLENGDILARGRAVTRAQGILLELLNSLNGSVDADLSRRLALLYDYMLRKLEEGHREQSPAAFSEVEQLLRNLQESWKELAQEESQQLKTVAAPASDSNPAACLA